MRVLDGHEAGELFLGCARLHQKEIPGGFLASLGVPFLSDLYRHIARSSESILITAGFEAQPDGFICGSMASGSLLKRFVCSSGIKHLPRIGIAAVKGENLRKIFETVRYMRTFPAEDNLPAAEILNFAVSADRQGCGTGRLLFRLLCEEFESHGINQFRIVTGREQLSAIRFYESAGSRRIGPIQLHKGADSVLFIHDLAKI